LSARAVLAAVFATLEARKPVISLNDVFVGNVHALQTDKSKSAVSASKAKHI